jgi:bile acid:Na+ symporter, BASS family
VLQLGPLTSGALLRAHRPDLAAPVHRWARRVADVSLVVLVVGLLVTQADELDRVGPRGLGLMSVLVLLTLSTVLLPVGPAPVRRAAAMTTTVRNLSLALLAATYAEDVAGTTLAVLAYGLVMYLLSAAAIVVLRRAGRATE